MVDPLLLIECVDMWATIYVNICSHICTLNRFTISDFSRELVTNLCSSVRWDVKVYRGSGWQLALQLWRLRSSFQQTRGGRQPRMSNTNASLNSKQERREMVVNVIHMGTISQLTQENQWSFESYCKQKEGWCLGNIENFYPHNDFYRTAASRNTI